MGETRILAGRGVKVRVGIPLFVIAIAVIGIYWFGKWSERQGVEDRNIIQAAQRSLAAGKAWRARRNRLLAISRAHADTARKVQLVIPPITLEMGPVELRGVARSWQAVASHWEMAFRAESLRADGAEARIADLELRLREVLTVADCHMLGVSFFPKCPSRTVAYVLGVATTGGVVLLARTAGPK